MNERVGIVGLGLIGGSLALALKRAGLAVVGVDIDERTRALAASLVDAFDDLESCTLIVLATPPATLLEQIDPVRRRLAPGAILTDVCGAKEEICRQGAGPAFVGGHPMAGTEFRGFEAASARLFEGAVVALCPGPAPREVVERVAALWRLAGATRILEIDPVEHDRAVTFASHLPYLAAASVVEALVSSGPAARLARELAAGGFRDTTRVAGDWTLSAAAALNRFLPDAARDLAERLAALAEDLRRDPGPAVERLRALAEERRAMPLPPKPGAAR